MSAVVPSPEHLDLLADDFRHPALDVLLVGVLPRVEPSFDVDLTALAQIVARNLGGPAEADDAVPLDLIAEGAVGVLDAAARGEGQLRDDVAAAGGVHLGIAAEVADEDYFVDHVCSFQKKRPRDCEAVEIISRYRR